MNRKYDWVTSPQYKHVAWPYKFTRDCQYDQKSNDDGCRGCAELKGFSTGKI